MIIAVCIAIFVLIIFTMALCKVASDADRQVNSECGDENKEEL